MKWIEAVKIWNASHNKGTWCMPRRGSPEHAAVKKIQGVTKDLDEDVAPPKPKTISKEEAHKQIRANKAAFQEKVETLTKKSKQSKALRTLKALIAARRARKAQREESLKAAAKPKGISKEEAHKQIRANKAAAAAAAPAPTPAFNNSFSKNYKEDKESYGVMGEMGDDSYRIGRLLRYIHEDLGGDKSALEKEYRAHIKGMKGFEIGDEVQFRSGYGYKDIMEKAAKPPAAPAPPPPAPAPVKERKLFYGFDGWLTDKEAIARGFDPENRGKGRNVYGAIPPKNRNMAEELTSIRSLGQWSWRRFGGNEIQGQDYQTIKDSSGKYFTTFMIKGVKQQYSGYWAEWGAIIGKTVVWKTTGLRSDDDSLFKSEVEVLSNGDINVKIPGKGPRNEADLWLEQYFGATLMDLPEEAYIKDKTPTAAAPAPAPAKEIPQVVKQSLLDSQIDPQAIDKLIDEGKSVVLSTIQCRLYLELSGVSDTMIKELMRGIHTNMVKIYVDPTDGSTTIMDVGEAPTPAPAPAPAADTRPLVLGAGNTDRQQANYDKLVEEGKKPHPKPTDKAVTAYIIEHHRDKDKKGNEITDKKLQLMVMEHFYIKPYEGVTSAHNDPRPSHPLASLSKIRDIYTEHNKSPSLKAEEAAKKAAYEAANPPSARLLELRAKYAAMKK